MTEFSPLSDRYRPRIGKHWREYPCAPTWTAAHQASELAALAARVAERYPGDDDVLRVADYAAQVARRW